MSKTHVLFKVLKKLFNTYLDWVFSSFLNLEPWILILILEILNLESWFLSLDSLLESWILLDSYLELLNCSWLIFELFVITFVIIFCYHHCYHQNTFESPLIHHEALLLQDSSIKRNIIITRFMRWRGWIPVLLKNAKFSLISLIFIFLGIIYENISSLLEGVAITTLSFLGERRACGRATTFLFRWSWGTSSSLVSLRSLSLILVFFSITYFFWLLFVRVAFECFLEGMDASADFCFFFVLYSFLSNFASSSDFCACLIFVSCWPALTWFCLSCWQRQTKIKHDP